MTSDDNGEEEEEEEANDDGGDDGEVDENCDDDRNGMAIDGVDGVDVGCEVK